MPSRLYERDKEEIEISTFKIKVRPHSPQKFNLKFKVNDFMENSSTYPSDSIRLLKACAAVAGNSKQK